MANWKKVVVSGSSAELALLNVDGNISATASISGSAVSAQTITNDPAIATATHVLNTKITGSFSGSFQGSYLNSDGTALTAEWDGTLNVADQPVASAQITGSGAAPSLILSGSTGNDLEVSNNASIGGNISADGTVSGSAVSAQTITNDPAVATATHVLNTKVTGSFSGSFKGSYLNSDGTALTAEWDGTLNLADQSISSAQITGSGGAPSLILSGSTGFDLEVSLDAKVNNRFTASKVLADDFDVSAAQDVTLFDTVGNNNLTIGASTTTVKIPGDLDVNGTASFNHATNLSVADKYILLNSGSQTAGDGGIVVQQSDGGVGELFGYDSSANRFGITASFDADTSSDFIPDAFMGMVVSGSTGQNNPNAAGVPARYNQAGNIFTAENGDLFIYSNV